MMMFVFCWRAEKRDTEVTSPDQSRDIGRATTIGQAHIQYAWRFFASSARFAANQGNYSHRRERRGREDLAEHYVVSF